MQKLNTLLMALMAGLTVQAQQQSFWQPVSEAGAGNNLFQQKTKPAAYKLFLLQQKGMAEALREAPHEKDVAPHRSAFYLSVPDAAGVLQTYRVAEAPVMEPALAARFPQIKSYAGVGVAEPTAYIRFSMSPLGFHAMILYGDKPTVYISPLDKKRGYYMVASRSDFTAIQNSFECLTKDLRRNRNILPNPGPQLKNADDARLRTFRLAFAATGEFSALWQEGGEPDDNARRANVLAAQNMLLTRCNGIFEKDFGLRLNLIANNTDIIFLDAATDPWPGTGLNSQTQTTIDASIGSANYDIGHLLTSGGNNGNAGCIGCVCTNGSKGSGFTSLAGGNWSNDLFVIDYLPHEIGHQLGGNHSFSHASEAPSFAQVEPGSGTTIMGYAGITGATTDVAAHSHDNFHAVSIQQITDYIKGAGCANVTNSGNNNPTANAGADFTIPHSTPFTLTGSGSDADAADVLNYVWEQMDVATVFGGQPAATQTTGPLFRCFPPLAAGSRTFPALASILNGSNGNTWEVLPSVGRTMSFRFTVRDNHAGTGGNNSDDMLVTVDGGKGPFAVTTANTATAWCPGPQNITWSVNGSDALAANVNILLSYDGGNSFPVTLAANTANDGSETVNIPCTFSNTARIKVAAAGNIFFDISNANITVGDNTKPTFTAPANRIIFKDANCNYNAAASITGDVTDEADNCSTGLNALFSDAAAPGSCVGETIITRTWTLTDGCGNSTVKLQTITVKDSTAPTFTVPANTVIYKDALCNHDASPAVTGDVTDEADNCDNTLNATFTDVTVPGSCIGEAMITRTWSLTDDCGNNSSKNQLITVKDTTAPVISAPLATPSFLWPPNHKMILVTVNYTLTDNCSPASAISSALSVSSNEPVNGTGDGNTAPDWTVVNKNQVWLRAERAGPRSGRIYTITVTAKDDCGNMALPKTVQVRVDHDQRLVRGNEGITSGNEGVSAVVQPNPSYSSFVLMLHSSSQERIQIRVTDVLGRLVENRSFGNTTAPIRIGDNYRPGVYIVDLIQGHQRTALKLMKLKY